jgi:diguanylate cyclase (GGDEF)-like protein/PAS domain S-box-containing protein
VNDTSPSPPAKSYRRTILRAFSIESIIALAIALTVIAVAYREPLTKRTLEFTPQSMNTSVYVYAYNDANNGGTSVSSYDRADPFHWTCTLGPGYQWPYCGYGLLFDMSNNGHGLDLRNYERVELKLVFRGSAKLINVTLKDHDPRYQSLIKPLDKVDQASFPVVNGVQTIPLSFADFGVAGWWKDQTKAPAALAQPSFRNIVAMELTTQADGGLGTQQIELKSVTFERRWISPGAWFGGIALFWMVLVTSLLTFRRHQIDQLKAAAEQALRKRERLHRTILETSTDCIILFSQDGRVEFANGRALSAFGMGSLPEVHGRHWSEIWGSPASDIARDTLGRAAAGKTVRMRYQGSVEPPKWWDVVVTPMLEEDGNVRGMLSISRDITAELEHTNQLKWASEHDSLTHLPNRRAFQARLQAATLRAMETGEQIGLLLIDLDHFKHVNDALGHSAGDELLRSVAGRLREGVRNDDFVARIGGDEFAIILEHVASEKTLTSVGDLVVSLIQEPLKAGNRVVTAGASIGGALFPQDAATANDLFKHADTALYALKQSGRGGTRLFDSYMLVEAEKTATQLRVARGAVSEKSVIPAYQPKFNLETSAIAGFEALLRWRDPRDGLQLPGTLEEAFNDYELAAKIGELMQKKVAANMRGWIESGLDFGRIAINAAPAEFLRDDYAERILAILFEQQVPPELVEVEITEHAFLGRATEYVARALQVLKAANVTISLDDFGTGYSSLSHLRDFPVDLVKIDMSFVQKMSENEEIAAIVAAVVSLARSLSIQVVAEGVETTGQLDLLRAMGCHMAQGHLLSPAIEADAVPTLLPGNRAAA